MKQMKSDIFKIKRDRPAARIQEAILAVNREGKTPEVWPSGSVSTRTFSMKSLQKSVTTV